jgi:hypothetical protein
MNKLAYTSVQNNIENGRVVWTLFSENGRVAWTLFSENGRVVWTLFSENGRVVWTLFSEQIVVAMVNKIVGVLTVDQTPHID